MLRMAHREKILKENGIADLAALAGLLGKSVIRNFQGKLADGRATIDNEVLAGGE